MLPNIEMTSLDLEDIYHYLSTLLTGKASDSSGRKLSMSLWPCHLALLRLHIYSRKFYKNFPMVTHLRAEDFESVLYLDDFLLLVHSKEACRNVQAHINTLSDLGFIINFGKSELEPVCRCKYLGFVFDSESHQSVPFQKPVEINCIRLFQISRSNLIV